MITSKVDQFHSSRWRDYYWRGEWFLTVCRRYIVVNPAHVPVVLFFGFSDHKVGFNVDGRTFKWWQLRGVLNEVRERKSD